MQQKRSALSQLIQLAKADDEVDPIEYKLILRIAEILGINQKEVDELFETATPFKPAPSEFQRIEQFHRLVLVANVDLKVESEELHQLKKFGMALGLRPEAVQRVISEMGQHPRGMIPAQTMLKIFQTYHN